MSRPTTHGCWTWPSTSSTSLNPTTARSWLKHTSRLSNTARAMPIWRAGSRRTASLPGESSRDLLGDDRRSPRGGTTSGIHLHDLPAAQRSGPEARALSEACSVIAARARDNSHDTVLVTANIHLLPAATEALELPEPPRSHCGSAASHEVAFRWEDVDRPSEFEFGPVAKVREGSHARGGARTHERPIADKEQPPFGPGDGDVEQFGR